MRRLLKILGTHTHIPHGGVQFADLNFQVNSSHQTNQIRSRLWLPSLTHKPDQLPGNWHGLFDTVNWLGLGPHGLRRPPRFMPAHSSTHMHMHMHMYTCVYTYVQSMHEFYKQAGALAQHVKKHVRKSCMNYTSKLDLGLSIIAAHSPRAHQAWCSSKKDHSQTPGDPDSGLAPTQS